MRCSLGLGIGLGVGLVVGCQIVGCGGRADQPATTAQSARRPSAASTTTADPGNAARSSSPPRAAAPPAPAAAPKTSAASSAATQRSSDSAPSGRPPRRTLADLLPADGATGGTNGDLARESAEPSPTTPAEIRGAVERLLAADPPRETPPPAVQVNAARVEAAGIRKIVGHHLTLYTDLPVNPEIDELPRAFDQAVPQWATYFELPAERLKDWHLVGSLIKDRRRFERAGLIDNRTPLFPDGPQGLQDGLRIWLCEQDSPYYRRHLLLHEGTHAVMNTLLGGAGPPWYAEGLAELLGTHRWADGRLTLGIMPRHRDDVPDWGRIKIVRDDMRDGRGKSLADVMRYGPDAHQQVQAYGWCWAVCYFLDGHPKSRAVLRGLRGDVRDVSLDFSRRAFQQLKDDWSNLTEDWQLFATNLEYGYDLPRNLVQHAEGQPLPAAGATFRVAVDRGWQSTGIQLEANHGYEFIARGRYRLVAEPDEWQCEAGGVTLRYHQGHPLGMLLGAIRPATIPDDRLSPLVNPDEIGLGRRAVIEQTGTLYVRVNDAPSELADNSGHLTLEVRPVPVSPPKRPE